MRRAPPHGLRPGVARRKALNGPGAGLAAEDHPKYVFLMGFMVIYGDFMVILW